MIFQMNGHPGGRALVLPCEQSEVSKRKGNEIVYTKNLHFNYSLVEYLKRKCAEPKGENEEETEMKFMWGELVSMCVSF